jgi:uncharacterized protein (TIGR02680 family)
MTEALVELPRPALERWQPLRGGLINLFRYDNEEFHYEQGRLLLRGNNGTGKSRVLALQLPFLLDGETASYRLEPDGDNAKRLEWNLLMDRHDDRLGYTWIEFGRREGTEERYLTLGCGLHAIKGHGLAGRWFFITPQRVGRDLFLVSEGGYPVTRERLTELLGATECLHTTAKAYRKAVDGRLFGLGERRYAALLDLLVQLRKPQLSRDLDERHLSKALSDALPPPSDQVLADVAHAMRELEADRTTLDDFRQAASAVVDFMREYRGYVRIGARRRAADLRRHQRIYEETNRTLLTAQRDLDDARKRRADALEQREVAKGDLGEAEVAAQTLAERNELRDLRNAEESARQREEELDRAGQEQDRASAALESAAEDAQEAKQSLTEQTDEANTVVTETSRAADTCGLTREHEREIEALGPPEAIDLERLAAAGRALDRVLADRREALALLVRLEQERHQAHERFGRAREREEELQAQLAAAAEAEQKAHAAVEHQVRELTEEFRGWAGGVAVLDPPDTYELAARIEAWSESREGPAPVGEAVQAALGQAVSQIAGARAEVEGRRREVEARLAAVESDYRRLDEGRHVPPPAPHTRDAGAREGRLGAPLWRLCDFADGLDGARQSGFEAALEAAGLLDAWVMPDGTLVDSETLDAVLIPAGDEPLPSPHLGDVLRPAGDVADAGVDAKVVASILSRIGIEPDAGGVWAADDGRYGLGPLRGRWRKTAAEHVGTAARDQARLRRMSDLRVEIDAMQASLSALGVELSMLDGREQQARAEADAAPDEEALRQAAAVRDAKAEAIRDCRHRVVEQEGRVTELRRDTEQARQKLEETAQAVGLSAWIDDLRGLDRALANYDGALKGLWPTLRGQIAAAKAAMRTAAALATAEGRVRERTRLHEEARVRAREAIARRDTVRKALGAEVEEIRRRLDVEQRRVEVLKARVEALDADERRADIDAAKAEERVAQHEKQVPLDRAERDRASAALGALGATGLLQAALVHPPEDDAAAWSVTRAVEVARAIEQELAEVEHSDDAWQRSQRGIHGHYQSLVQALMARGYSPDATVEAELFVVTAQFHGRRCNVADLRSALEDEIAQRQALLSAREREILENHLLDAVATHLHDRLHDAERLVQNMTAELEQRPTSTGMKLRFTWEPLADAPPDLEAARRILMQTGRLWSPQNRETVGAFLQRLIDAVRSQRDTGTWQEHLHEALDYRAWHHFGVQRFQDGRWKPLTRRTHGTGSGGEKAIALTLPQFAAAAAHYRSAQPTAPRLVLLDEAFVGVDRDMRDKCMGLLAAFDLDFVMTSEREWGCYPSLPGVAIYHLSTRPGVDAVAATRWIWNGRERVRADVTLPSRSSE